MELTFYKMHGLGNDFVLLDFIDQENSLTKAQYRLLADRHFGVGCDQILQLESPQSANADIRYRIFNADGSEAEQCGNGARCVALYLHSVRALNKDVITADTAKGQIQLYKAAETEFRIDMDKPQFEPQAIPFAAHQQSASYTIDTEAGEFEASVLSMGNPHAVITVDDINTVDIARLGPAIQQQPLFPESVNVGFMQIVDEKNIKLRVYERGVGETLACGSGACAAVVAGRNNHALAETVRVQLKGGELLIEWQGNGEVVWMTGPAELVYEGKIKL